MYIKSITLDGFKSYGNRVEITGFDPTFNAITGFNGTGKSNILDSICFVLGISNLSNVRAGSLQDLIYKQGQAGITKATVSITFDNRDKNQTPIGYETTDEITITRQIVMGGKNKYLINGINVQNRRVYDLFCSVQLNVNNPHFLIMQGRITKVLNMKPPEILSMIEEAAGTSMYETKKMQAQSTIAKKDAKLTELESIIREDISPKLQKLQDERSQYQEHQQVTREIDSVEKLYKAYQYDLAVKKNEEVEKRLQAVRDEIKLKKDSIKSNERECKNIDKEIIEMNRKLDEENSNILEELERELGALERQEARAASALKAQAEDVSSHEQRARLLERALHDDVAALHAKRAASHQASSTFENLRVASESSEAALAAAQERFLAVSSGLEDASDSLQDQLMAAKQAASEAATRISQAAMEQRAAEERLRRLRGELASSSAQYQRDQDDIRRKQAQHLALADELSRVSFSEERHSQLTLQLRGVQASARGQRDRVDAAAAPLQRCHFRYSAPQPGFHPASVHGTVARLIDVCDPIYCTALETAAGGRLYNVVVDTEVTSKLLLQRGNLQTRTTIIPLNKISGHVIDSSTVAAAQEIGGGADKVQLALNLISFSWELSPAMAWVFGGTLVCQDLHTAKRVCFHPRVRRRCVTLDGDVFDPSGTLSGGARVKGGSVLVQLQELKQLERELQLTEQRLADCSEELSAMQREADTYHSLKQRLDTMAHELGVVEARLGTTSHAQTHAEVQSLEAQVSELREALERDKVTQKEAAARARDLEAKVKDIKGHREREFKKAEEALKVAKRDAAQHGAAWTGRAQELETLQMEVSELQAAVASSQAHLADTQHAAAALLEARALAQRQHQAALEAAQELQARIKRQKSEISGRNSEIARRALAKENLLKLSQDTQLQVQELEFSLKQLGEDAAESVQFIKRMEADNNWMKLEKQFFGAAGGLYDFTAKQAHLAAARLQQLATRRDKLARGLNARAHALLGKEEEQYQELLRKKKIVEADRAKLVEVMHELDEKKRTTLIQACEQVNRDFGSIFSSLLPDSQAELKPPHGKTVLDGLEVRVGFNNTWKESLGELSGGQRSLVALSLVLAMLLFKPAPLYILDEVDAALDLSHTQNIGIMLRDHFRHSQFIIVSLKDGMFNNANVLFKTQFVDGMSAVTRTQHTRHR